MIVGYFVSRSDHNQLTDDDRKVVQKITKFPLSKVMGWVKKYSFPIDYTDIDHDCRCKLKLVKLGYVIEHYEITEKELSEFLFEMGM